MLQRCFGRGVGGCRGGAFAFEHNVCDAARATQPLHLQRLAEEGEQAGVEVDFADERQQRLGGRADGGSDFEAVDGGVGLGAVPYLKAMCEVCRW